jgi:type IV secretory pathway VirB10-like protein
MSKYTDYNPNRTPQQIRQEIAMIQAVDKYRSKNKRRAKKTDYLLLADKIISSMLYTACAASLVYMGYHIIKK